MLRPGVKFSRPIIIPDGSKKFKAPKGAGNAMRQSRLDYHGKQNLKKRAARCYDKHERRIFQFLEFGENHFERAFIY
jgi:hypothetical protein